MVHMPDLHTNLLIPRGYNALHVQVGGEEADNPVRDNGHHLGQQAPVVPDDGRVVPSLELGGQRHLVVALHKGNDPDCRCIDIQRERDNERERETPNNTLETIMGRMHCLARVMVKLAMMTGWKSNILGYMSRGESVPLVITTL